MENGSVFGSAQHGPTKLRRSIQSGTFSAPQRNFSFVYRVLQDDETNDYFNPSPDSGRNNHPDYAAGTGVGTNKDFRSEAFSGEAGNPNPLGSNCRH